MKRLYILIPLLLLITSCAKEKPENIKIPKGIIPPDKMEKVLTDVHLVEGSLVYIRSKKGDYEELKNYYYSFIFEKHNISREQYEKSILFYQDHIDLFEEIYGKVFRNLEKKRSEPII